MINKLFNINLFKIFSFRYFFILIVYFNILVDIMVFKVYCKEDFFNVVFDLDCNRLKDSVCIFFCKEGFQKKDEDIVEFICMFNGKWNFGYILLCVGM